MIIYHFPLCAHIRERREGIMFFGKRDKDVRLTEKQFKDLTSNMSKKERREFDRRQEELRREREDERLDAWLDFEDEMDGL